MDLNELKKLRSNIRQRLTHFNKYLTPLLGCKETSKVQINELALRLSKIRDLMSSFDDVQSQIEMSDEDATFQMNERETTENSFYSIIAQAQGVLEFFQNENKVAPSSHNSGTCKTVTNLKLPPLKIPPFNGDSSKWLSFRDTYLSVIHHNENIDDISKFHYLRSYLEGTACSVINSVTVSSKNYTIAWDLLCERYDNKRLLINEHIKSLFSIEPIYKESESCIRFLIDTLSKNLSALNILGEPTDKWDTIIIYLASTKLDSVTARNWEEYRNTIDSPTLEQFYTFLRQRATVLETVTASRCNKNEKRHSFTKSKSFIASSSGLSLSHQCIICKQSHKIYACLEFKSLPVEERIARVKTANLCSNCLRGGHQPFQCKLSGCRICQRKHNTLLHKQYSVQAIPTNHVTQTTKPIPTTKSITTILPDANVSTASGPSKSVSMSAVSANQALLCTALVRATNNGNNFILRALLDCGSQSSFITKHAQEMIGICKLKQSYHSVSGLGNATFNVTDQCEIQIHSLHTSYNTTVKCFILPTITDNLPHATVHVQDMAIPKTVELADPRFFQPSKIDLLLGADVFWNIIGSDKISLGPQKPNLLETQLGWVVAGPTGGCYNKNKPSKLNCYFSQDIKNQLSKFWELEEIPVPLTQNKNDYCEQNFAATTCRLPSGAFSVQIPLKESVNVLGDSYSIAEKRLHQLEKKLNKNHKLKQDYHDFIHEYERLGHMTEIGRPEFGCYLPHHAVVKDSSETTKLRVVFDASAKTSTGISFNDIQYVGPVVQEDLFSILLRYRQHQFVVSADIEKMYRCILIEPSQRNLQLILWRDEPTQPIKVFQLNTVTYGTASAPFLSTRCLVQLVNEYNSKNICTNECYELDNISGYSTKLHNDKISQSIRDDFYVDDYLSGADCELELSHKVHSVAAVLKTACFPLRKFRTNVPSIFKDNTDTLLPKSLSLSSQSSTLGLKWDPVKDIFRFPVNIQHDPTITKRSILSNSSRLFDPLGLLGPCMIIPKIILQRLWLTKLDWDDQVDCAIEREWRKFVSELLIISNIEIPRCVIISKARTIELHAFSDASQLAYASAIYLLSINNEGSVLTRLICAKTRVAPVKPTTIPRLELCGALLSARLSAQVQKTLRCKIDKVIYWTDSTVVLAWLYSQSRDLKPFVANRVGEIQELTSTESWRHVPGDMNPADLASRGLSPKLIESAAVWWQGPYFLTKDPSEWPRNISDKLTVDISERRAYPKNLTTATLHAKITQTTDLHSSSKDSLTNLVNPDTRTMDVIDVDRFSKFSILLRSMAYVLRFIQNLRHTNTKNTSYLTKDELGCFPWMF